MKKCSFLLSTIFLLSGACGNGADTDGPEKPPHKPPTTIDEPSNDVLRVVTYNIIGFSYDRTNYPDGTYSLIAAMMKEIGADVVCLNEVDENTNRRWKDNQMLVFSTEMGGWDYVYGRAMPYDGGYYGEGVATKEKIVKKVSVPLPQGVGAEPRVMALAEMEDYIIATTHLDHASEEAHAGQIDAIEEYLEANYGDYKKPIFLAGDLNATPDSNSIGKLKARWTILSPTNRSTFPSNAPSKCIDFILAYNNGAEFELVQSMVMTHFTTGNVTKASDHLPVMADIKLPPAEE